MRALFHPAAKPPKRDDAPDTVRIQATLDIELQSLRACCISLKRNAVRFRGRVGSNYQRNSGVPSKIRFWATLSLRAAWRRGAP